MTTIFPVFFFFSLICSWFGCLYKNFHGCLIPIALEENDIESSNENDNVIKKLFNIETIDAKEDTQLKVVIVYPNTANVVVRETFDLTKNINKNLALKKWKRAANQVFKHPEMKQYVFEAMERAVSEEFANLSKSDTILKGRNVDEVNCVFK